MRSGKEFTVVREGLLDAIEGEEEGFMLCAKVVPGYRSSV